MVVCSRCKKERPVDSCWCLVGGGEERHFECQEACILTSARVAAVNERLGIAQGPRMLSPVPVATSPPQGRRLKEERISTLELIMTRLSQTIASKPLSSSSKMSNPQPK